jgi:hypothetical protein
MWANKEELQTAAAVVAAAMAHQEGQKNHPVWEWAAEAEPLQLKSNN